MRIDPKKFDQLKREYADAVAAMVEANAQSQAAYENHRAAQMRQDKAMEALREYWSECLK